MSDSGSEKLDLLAVPRRKGDLAFAVAIAVVSLLLLSQVGNQTTWLEGARLLKQPAFWPALGVAGMSFFAVLYLIGGWRDPQRKMREADFAREIIVWLRGLEFTLWFMAYVFAVPVAGYLPTTMVFCAVLSLRAGYRSARMLSAAVALGAVIVVGFKTFLQVRIPGGALYEIFPEALRNFLIVYF